jgi:hypothetical protein
MESSRDGVFVDVQDARAVKAHREQYRIFFMRHLIR